MFDSIAAVVLAAGDGKRMKSAKQKVTCCVLSKPMLSWVLDACKNTGIDLQNCCVVVSEDRKEVDELLPNEISTAVQSERLGTGHAVMCATDFLKLSKSRGVKDVAVLCGDSPFIDSGSLLSALTLHREEQNSVTVITADCNEPASYGRIVRNGGRLEKIVEFADATKEEKEITEINSGVYWFNIDFLLEYLPELKNANSQNEYYITDMIAPASIDKKGGAFVCENPNIVLGANDRISLSKLNHIARDAILDKLRGMGADIPLNDGIIIGPDVTIGRDTTILPGCMITGDVKIGEGCVIGPNTRIIDCEIGNGSIIESSRLEKSKIGSNVRIGPFAQIRPNCTVADKVKIGNFVEVKNSVIGEKTSLAHLTYIGDSDFGGSVNVGCGVVTVNYDGRGKYRTVVEDGAFIGCNTNLIAPVKVGAGAYVAAATTVTEDVSSESLAIGRVKQSVKEGWVKQR